MNYLYNLLVHILAPFAFLVHGWRGLRDRAHWERLGERFGYTRLRFVQQPIWIHAVSVGEVQAALPLIRALLAKPAGAPLLITTGTVTGAARVRAALGERVHHCYLPYDLPGSVSRFLARTQPRLGVIMETELWPNLFRACVQRNIPLVLASARISPRTAARYRRLAILFRESLPQVFIAAQSSTDAERFASLGANAARLSVSGNIKFDIEIGPEIFQAGRAWRRANASTRVVWAAGSTHEGEEEQVLTAHRELRNRLPGALLILAPRHPQRFAQVKALLEKQAVVFAARSTHEMVTDDTQVLLLDTLGELTQFYAASDVVFVGGSLVPIGGHNLLEPAALALPAVSGPSVFNAQDIAQQLFEAGAVTQVSSANELAGVVGDLLNGAEQRVVMGSKALAIVKANRGALERILQVIERAENARAAHPA